MNDARSELRLTMLKSEDRIARITETPERLLKVPFTFISLHHKHFHKIMKF